MHVTHIGHHERHLAWDKSIKPVATVNSGDIVTFDLPEASGGQLTAQSTVTDVRNLDFSLLDPANGPVYVRDAEPGDVLAIRFLELKPGDFGWSAIVANFGLLTDEFPDPAYRVWDLTQKNGDFAVFKEGIHIPIRPFLGVVGVAPAEEGAFSTIPPYETGGNIDCKHITQGSVLYLPVKVPGALFSCGDGHAAQGDGEICGTAIETPMRAKVQLTVEKNMPWVTSPQFTTASVPAAAEWPSKGTHAALGIDADLREAARKSVRNVIAWLVAEKALTRVEAYMLISVTGDLKIVEAVDMPNYAVACCIPLNIFQD